MYTSYYSSSPIRTSASETTETNYQYESYRREHNQSSHIKYINPIDDSNMNLRRNNDGYSHSISSMASNPLTTPTSSRRYLNNYNTPNDYNRYQSANFSPSSPYRSYGNDNDLFRGSNSRYNLSSNSRAYSCDDLRNEQNRFQPSMHNSRCPPSYKPPIAKRDQYYNYDDDENEDIVVKSTDLPARYEQEMLQLVQTAFRRYDITNQRELAGFLKRSADSKFSPCWHCIVGRQFSSYVTHEMNGFIYFTRGPLSILLFRSGA